MFRKAKKRGETIAPLFCINRPYKKQVLVLEKINTCFGENKQMIFIFYYIEFFRRMVAA